MHYVIALVFLAILTALATALLFMLRRPGEGLDKADNPLHDAAQTEQRSKRMAQALAWRIALSIALFVCLLLAYSAGWMQPTGLHR